MRTLRFGIEIETIGQTRARVAAAIQGVVGGTVQHVGTPYCYDPYDVIAEDGRRWRVMADSSLSAEKARQAEVVSPILRYEDIETLQEVIRAVRRAGARVDTSCGIHVHVDAARFDAKALRNLVKIVNKQERLIEHALGINDARRARSDEGGGVRVVSAHPSRISTIALLALRAPPAQLRRPCHDRCRDGCAAGPAGQRSRRFAPVARSSRLCPSTRGK